MVDIVGQAKVIVFGEVDKRSVDQAGGKLGARLKAASVLGVAALGTLTVAGIKSVAAFEEAESVSRKLNNTLANMGKSGAAESVNKLADSLERQTGVDGDLIKKGETLLATFSEVASSAGKAGGTFDRATRAAVDLAAAGFGSVESASVQLGKALQDPVKGISALSKSGVTFTEVQKKQIENFVKTGDVAAAQNIILGEVEKQVKGTAEAGAKASDKLKSAIGAAQESLGGLIVDLFDQGKGKKSLVELAADATFKFADAVSKFQKSKDWKELKKDLHSFGSDAKTVAGALTSIVGSMNSLSKKTTGSGLLHWLNEVDKRINPLRQVASLLKQIETSWRQLQDFANKGISSDLIGGGGRTFASGGRSITGGLALVGEQGPEIIRVPSGADIYSNRESRQIAASASGGGTVNYNLYGPGSLSEARREQDWAAKYGTRYGAATMAGAL